MVFLIIKEAVLKRIEIKEVERAEANAILAAHYLKIGQYYPKGKFDKYLKNLVVEDAEE